MHHFPAPVGFLHFRHKHTFTLASSPASRDPELTGGGKLSYKTVWSPRSGCNTRWALGYIGDSISSSNRQACFSSSFHWLGILNHSMTDNLFLLRNVSGGFSMTACSPTGSVHRQHQQCIFTSCRHFRLILTPLSFSFHLIPLDSHCISTSVTPLCVAFLLSICLALEADGAYLYQAAARIVNPQSFLPDKLLCNCSLSSPKQKKRVTTGKLLHHWHWQSHFLLLCL